MLLLLVTYGLRSREVAALTLDDVDWKRERLAIPERKAGHSTAFPLSREVGEARSSRPRSYLLRTGITVPRPGSHTLRHSAVQRLVDAGFSLKTIGDHVGHRSAAFTDIYARWPSSRCARSPSGTARRCSRE